MKKFFLMIAIMLLTPVYGLCYENVVPHYVSVEHTNTYGVYQAPSEIVFPESVKADDLFVVFIPSKNLGLLAVTDETEDWVQVIYNNSTGAKGWIKKDDPYRFMSWIMFYNMYGKKYGLMLLKEAPAEAKDLHTSTDDKSQIVGTINMPQKINLNVMRGNWALVSVMDIDKVPKTGYVKWRSDNGVKYYFPAIK